MVPVVLGEVKKVQNTRKRPTTFLVPHQTPTKHKEKTHHFFGTAPDPENQWFRSTVPATSPSQLSPAPYVFKEFSGSIGEGGTHTVDFVFSIKICIHIYIYIFSHSLMHNLRYECRLSVALSLSIRASNAQTHGLRNTASNGIVRKQLSQWPTRWLHAQCMHMKYIGQLAGLMHG